MIKLIMPQERIIWKKEFLLSENDFAGTRDNSLHDAVSSVGIDYECKIDWVDNNKNSFKLFKIQTYAYFQPNKSHFPNFAKDPGWLLNHEQGHFDLAEEYARKLKDRIENEVSGKKYPAKGKTEERKQEYGNKLAPKIISRLYHIVEEQHVKEHKVYDDETAHGKILLKQKGYDERFSGLRK